MASNEFWHSATPNFDAITTGSAAFLRLVVQDYSPINFAPAGSPNFIGL